MTHTFDADLRPGREGESAHPPRCARRRAGLILHAAAALAPLAIGLDGVPHLTGQLAAQFDQYGPILARLGVAAPDALAHLAGVAEGLASLAALIAPRAALALRHLCWGAA